MLQTTSESESIESPYVNVPITETNMMHRFLYSTLNRTLGSQGTPTHAAPRRATWCKRQLWEFRMHVVGLCAMRKPLLTALKCTGYS
jgi:hypothetical protein